MPEIFPNLLEDGNQVKGQTSHERTKKRFVADLPEEVKKQPDYQGNTFTQSTHIFRIISHERTKKRFVADYFAKKLARFSKNNYFCSRIF